MKSKALLIYAYVLPYVGSMVVAALPLVLPFISYADVAKFYQRNVGVCLALLAVAGGVSFPFQSKILHEDDPHVLGVLRKEHVRDVFRRASVVQAVTILVLSLVLVVLSAIQKHPYPIGFVQLLASCLIIFESLALVSNGIAYGKIRERIIDAANKALHGTREAARTRLPASREGTR
jgi:hypothetical protein